MSKEGCLAQRRLVGFTEAVYDDQQGAPRARFNLRAKLFNESLAFQCLYLLQLYLFIKKPCIGVYDHAKTETWFYA